MMYFLIYLMRLPFMYFVLVAWIGDYKLYKNHKANLAIIRDKDDNTVFKGTHYATNQEFLRLTCNTTNDRG